MDLPLEIPNLDSAATYPPYIKLHVSFTKLCTGESFCFLKVEGIDQELRLMLKIMPRSEARPHEKFGMCIVCNLYVACCNNHTLAGDDHIISLCVSYAGLLFVCPSAYLPPLPSLSLSFFLSPPPSVVTFPPLKRATCDAE